MTRDLKPCGTSAAYQRHLKYGKVTCRPCIDARNAEQNKRRRWRRARGRVDQEYMIRETVRLLAEVMGVPQ